MKRDGPALAQAAGTMIGARFRLHGRDAAHGLDCVGLVLEALRLSGRTPPAVPRYALRNQRIDGFLKLLPEVGLLPAKGPMVPGDLLLLRVSPAQFHLAIAADAASLIHAHAGLGRVVRTPAPLPWPCIGHWRLPHN